ncbi:ribonuclease H1 isoform X2 [Frieseomelitta varia]|nr:ribonuclease H1 isoform X2 [Frieseomelitta varia]XP_043513512.1 ribonuclease H1 isoform X2 [Frieseomelitta varia]
MGKGTKYYYAVAKGRKPGIYNSWDECQRQVHHFSGPVFKKFQTEAEAHNFIQQNTATSTNCDTKRPLNVRTSKRPRVESNENTDNKRLCSGKLKVIDLEECSEKKTSGGFNIDSNGYVNVYTDGACSSNGNINANAGIGVWFGDNHPLNVSRAVVGRATNNVAEIQAVTAAVKQAKKAGIKNLKINTDSQFLISCINDWMPIWKANGWVTSKKTPVINKVELLEMEEALKSLNVIWNHVNGHVGIHGNEMADKLARAGCLK